MLLDQKNNRWIAAFVALLATATALYVPYHLGALNGPSGGTWPGLIYGITGFLLMLFVGLLGLRRYLPAWRIGRLETWLRGHIWLGLLAFALIFFHSGFHFGGPLTTVLMILLIVTTLSGVLGLVLQQILPRVMTSQVPRETIYEQIDHVIAQLQDEARDHVVAVSGPLEAAGVETAAAAAAGKGSARPWSGIPESGVHKIKFHDNPLEGSPILKEFYLKQIRPYLRGEKRAGPLSSPSRSTVLFSSIRTMLPSSLHETLADLDLICEEYRQLRRQAALQLWMNGWLMVHAPLSYAFLVLAVVHAIYSLRY